MSDTIRSACYSNIHVYEMPVRGVPVMIRKSDSYVNATQILRAAGLAKPQRTKVLERDVARGTHEKVQGGYAGSQGTWIPLDAAIALSEQYQLKEECMPLFTYDMKSGKAEAVSPPLKVKKQAAPKPAVSDDHSSGDEKSRQKPLVPLLPMKREQRETRSKKNFNEDEEDEDEFSSSTTSSLRPAKKFKRSVKSRTSQLQNELSDVPMTRQGSSAMSRDSSGGPRSCEVCGVTETPQWRRGPSGKRTLCNACGVKWSSGRLKEIPKPQSSPFPFSATESETQESSDPTGFEDLDLQVGSAAWKLQLEVSRLKQKLREMEKNHKRLLKLVKEGGLESKEIDRNYRKILSSAKKSLSTHVPYKDVKRNENLYRGRAEDGKIKYGDATEHDEMAENIAIARFLAVIGKK